jgi:hypothetical protein
MTTSSPRSTLAKSLEKLVLASWTFINFTCVIVD